ncbi:MAG: biotin--[acetyl-CoA-carboxylase] ligase [Candidatus Cloacimonetes bacterium]|nr:biotin--[acetyl-CoA-carboxylase] ligase [Candidatus Cloacimonadota bacterium]HPM00779.1 biotin--[acetyl-CoA-carboxylase] ligase [Candidatus Cloacimonadota bacterium]
MSDILNHQKLNILQYHFKEVTSTMDIAENLIETNKLTQDFVVCADTQTNGRGRKGNKWISYNGGLWFTLGLYHYTFFPSLMIFTGIMLRRTLQDMFQISNLTIKWPNDIYIDNRKCCGIIATYNPLTKYHLIGIGVNTNNKISCLNACYQGVSLSDVLGESISNNNILNFFLENYYNNLQIYQESNLLTFLDEFEKNHLLNSHHIQVDCGNEIVKGYCEGIQADGSLLIKQNDSSLKTIYAGTVTVLNP